MVRTVRDPPEYDADDAADQGVSAQTMPDIRPMAKSSRGSQGGNGVSAQAVGRGSASSLTAPFPYYGGKRRLAPRIWERLGNPTVYAEPFAGSVACLLARPDGPGPREIVCDLDGGICNFWRAVQADPEAVAHWADYPTIHQDLTARHAWLRNWIAENRERLSADPDFHDARAAGWWVWGASLWIGGGWCHVEANMKESRPHLSGTGGVQTAMSPQNVSAQTGRPHVCNHEGGMGVAAQKRTQIPHIKDAGGGSGVSRQTSKTRPDILRWFARIQQRMAAVVVLNRSWESALTPSLLMQTASSPDVTVGILMDPPYLTEGRSNALYGSDAAGLSDDCAQQSYDWATGWIDEGRPDYKARGRRGEHYRIAYCAHEGDFPVPPGWEVMTETLGGIKRADRRHRRDCVMFSPACVGRQPGLWDDSDGGV